MKEYKFKINGKDYEVTIGEANGKNLEVNVNGASYQVELENAPAAAPAPVQAPVQQAEKAPSAAPAAAPSPAPEGEGVKVVSPMQGNVVEICAAVGDAVKNGQKLVIIESMKMEVEISATKDGTVTGILVSKGDHLEENQPVATIA